MISAAMTDGLWSSILLTAASFLGGAVNSIAGGGTLLTFPSLLAVLSPVMANATSTMALVPGTFGAIWGYRTELAGTRSHLIRLWPPSLLGGIAGSLLVTRLPEKVFSMLVPWLLVSASALLLAQRPLTRWLGVHRLTNPKPGTLIAVIVFQFAIGVYGGYFGAGIGILMLSSLAFVGLPDIHQMNAVKTVLGGTINGVTAVIFILAKVVVWKYALVMALASIVGGYLGARVARQMRPEYVRAVVVAIGFGVAAYSWLYR
jgi:uncharacterized membrane protein YfcA